MTAPPTVVVSEPPPAPSEVAPGLAEALPAFGEARKGEPTVTVVDVDDQGRLLLLVDPSPPLPGEAESPQASAASSVRSGSLASAARRPRSRPSSADRASVSGPPSSDIHDWPRSP